MTHHSVGIRPSMPPVLRQRLQEIDDLSLIAPSAGEGLQQILAEAATKFALPTSLVSVVLDEAQHFVAAHGLSGWAAATGGTPVEWSFCRIPVQTRQPYVVSDATQDASTRDNPFVLEESIGCYAGVPLITSRGIAVGAFCVMGPRARSFGQRDIDILSDYAAAVVGLAERRRRP